MTNVNRYNRQTVLPEIGAEGQENLTRANVLVIGAGGLGCPVLQYLAAAGIGTIGIVDNDDVDVTNLQRQTLFTTAQQGQKKVDAAKNYLEALNPDIEIRAIPERLTADNALNLMKDYDIIADGTDNFSAKFLINDAAVKLGKPVVYGSILGFEGQSSVFWASQKDAPCYRCLHPKMPSGYVPNCAEAGTIGALAGIIGSVQAMEVIKLAAPHETLKPLTGKLWVIDAHTMETNSYSISKNPECPVCSKKPEEIKLEDENISSCAAIPSIGIAESKNKQDAIFIDVREQNEWDEDHIEGALLCPLSVLTEGTEIPIEIPSDKTCIIYCRSGKRSLKAIEILTERGHSGLINLSGGFIAWSQAA